MQQRSQQVLVRTTSSFSWVSVGAMAGTMNISEIDSSSEVVIVGRQGGSMTM
ncbi:hypothetical protein C1H46_001723 [Malus baccata]|uniref:Uncharacterized protein n=1 Tax=Malus baccata TaxID=106549 RepID=A0A540NQ25_MALBA|nr:hypothetical protein C1H46_001723 [Malus baccata]